MADISERLRELCLDYDGSEIPDNAEPRSIPHCHLLREAADHIDADRDRWAALSGAQEAVAWRYQFRPGDRWTISETRPSDKALPPATGKIEPLYASPPVPVVDEANWTADEIFNLAANQTRGAVHPYTCPNRGDGNHRDVYGDLGALIPTRRGWVCPFCDYTQKTRIEAAAKTIFPTFAESVPAALEQKEPGK